MNDNKPLIETNETPEITSAEPSIEAPLALEPQFNETNNQSFTCECEKYMRTACTGLPANYEHKGKRYCVLHYPSKEKIDDFRVALDKKRSDEDFNFRGVYFPEEVNFYSIEFKNLADFSGATFSGAADFREAIFNERADFREAKFTHVDFKHATFSKDALFSFATFSTMADFCFATFSKETYFREAIFSGETHFRRVTFSQETHFRIATFATKADFHKAIFIGVVNFSEATFGAKADFSEATFADYALFVGTSDRLMFTEKSSLDLRQAFLKDRERISFHTVTLYPHWFVNTDPRKFAFTDVKWDWEDIEISCEIERLKEKGIKSPHRLFSKTCRELALNAEENHLYEDASTFRFMAMETERLKDSNGFVDSTKATFKAVNSLIREAEADDAPARLPEIWREQKKKFQSGKTWSFSKLLRLLYRILSGYGERVGRAFFILFALWLVFSWLYYIFEPFSFGRALSYSLAVMTFQRPDPKPTTELASAFVAIEAVLGPLQAALLALAIRRKFMR
jgi:uncharacterized protein YjbI with pentapeptide repeats